VENLNYSADALLRTWPSRFNAETAAKMARKPEAIANYVYGGRLGNGADGDGWKYRGRGLIQLTGKGNYRAAGIALGLDLIGNPDLLEKPEAASLSAAWFWKTNGLNALADANDVAVVTRKINGGLNGLSDRLERFDRAARALGI
jgi:putative chitinase